MCALLMAASCVAPEPETVSPETTRTAGGAFVPAPPAAVSDPALSARIDEALRGARGVDDSGIDVEVEGDRVALSGYVDSPTDVLIARDVVRAVPGVADVTVEDLRVRRR
jgi:hypothetical protein